MNISDELINPAAVVEQKSFQVRSSIADDVWHKDREAGAYEWWYFDAISDDGRDALVIIFLADFIFSPRYNRAVARYLQGSSGEAPPGTFPALAVSLYRNGRPLFRAINEYGGEDFAASTDTPVVRIGRSSFHLHTTDDKTSYSIHLDVPLRGGRRLEASLQWEVVEGDFSGDEFIRAASDAQAREAHQWNMVAPRCRVTGTLAVMKHDRRRFEEFTFRGLGYHDHNRDARWMPPTIAEWQWGRAHFDDVTAIYYRYRERTAEQPLTRLFIVHNNKLSAYTAELEIAGVRRDRFGLRYASNLRIAAYTETEQPQTQQHSETASGASNTSITTSSSVPVLLLRQRQTIDSSFFYLRFISDATLDLGDDRMRRAPAITEHLAPRALAWHGLAWLIDMRIGRDGRSSFLP